MDLSVRRVGPYAPENFAWLGSRHGTEATSTITLVVELFEGKSYFADGFIPSGEALGRITAVGATQGMYGPYDDVATDGRQVNAGHLMTSKSVVDSGLYIGAALLDHGKVRLSRLPAGHGLNANGQADVAGRIIYIA